MSVSHFLSVWLLLNFPGDLLPVLERRLAAEEGGLPSQRLVSAAFPGISLISSLKQAVFAAVTVAPVLIFF